ncbi:MULTISPECIES: iron-containing alcohol dehydrogenase [unclassified Variovorax]|uniref:iron-containing alcohol dehydrogenase n=1 Tax=unclassified Variovorax TaxID=663243 RepID=UPI00257761AB|nr:MULTISPECIES: iron-containing alcohol dehydrogenase [unclassified Variovorax]MDM0089324.1 iron-containing alcohol dehydrogenase [Variovorax sp. J22G40]MDM0147397.1 iron-containing alcohol dehydrogenase [Variovorax sp. J2P1-31]
MSPFSFQTVPRIVMQSGAAAGLGPLLASRFAVGRVCVITDAFLHRSGLLAPALESLRAQGWQVQVVDDVQADPPDHVVETVTARARAFGTQVVLGLGGGSSMDVAKLVAVLLGSTQPLAQMYGIDKVEGERLPLVQVPTTAGTGSEVTPIAIVTTGATTKSGIVARQLYADMAILDATLTTGLPAAITAATGIDAMVHAIEAYTSRHLKNPLSDHLALLALRLLADHLVPACEDGRNLAAREAMLLGAMLAGQAFANSPVAAVHALAYPLGGHFHLPHGLSNALVLPHVLRFNAAHAAAHYAQLGEALRPGLRGSDGEKTEAFIAHIESLAAATGLPMRLRDHGVGEADLPLLAADAMKQTRLLVNNPRELGEADALAIYRLAF